MIITGVYSHLANLLSNSLRPTFILLPTKMNRVKYFSVCLIHCLLLNSVSSARILAFYPVPFHSHQSVFHTLTEELARQGHELVVLAPDPQYKPLENVTQIDVLDMSYKLWEDAYAKFVSNRNGFSVSPITFWADMVHPTMHSIVDAQLSTPDMQAILQDPKQEFDVLLVESIITTSIVIAARFKAPIIQVSTFFGLDDNFRDMGAPVHPLLFPEFNSEKTWKISFWEKLSSLYTFLRFRIVNWNIKELENKLVKKHFGENAPTMDELRNNVHMLLLNVHHIWDNNRPVPPSVVYMGALHLKKPKPVTGYLQTYLDSSKNGVIYMSLGSKIRFSDLPPATINMLFKVFESLPYDVLIKWNGGEVPKKPQNVRLEKWLPQNDMLHHSKIKAFLMQGGLQSTDEAIAAKVPMIAFPVFGDQFYNAQKFVQLGIGKQLDINNLNEEDLRQAILDVASDKSYRDNLHHLSRVMEDQRAGGLQKAVYWIDHVAKHGALHLRSPLADATLADMFMLDILGVVLLVIATSFIALYFIGKLLYSSVSTALRNRRKQKSN